MMKKLLLMLLFVGFGTSVDAGVNDYLKYIIPAVAVPVTIYAVAPEAVQTIAQKGDKLLKKGRSWMATSLQKLWKKDKEQKTESA